MPARVRVAHAANHEDRAMQLSSLLHTSRRPIHTPDPLLNVFLACRTPVRPSSPRLITGLVHSIVQQYRKTGQRLFLHR
jgi:hypothetical protein